MAKNTGKYQNSAEGRRARRILCGDLKLIHDTAHEGAADSYSEGDEAGGKEHVNVAVAAASDAKRLGCGWAQ